MADIADTDKAAKIVNDVNIIFIELNLYVDNRLTRRVRRYFDISNDPDLLCELSYRES